MRVLLASAVTGAGLPELRERCWSWLPRTYRFAGNCRDLVDRANWLCWWCPSTRRHPREADLPRCRRSRPAGSDALWHGGEGARAATALERLKTPPKLVVRTRRHF